jgi:NADH-quinone oxidoreductase subunit G
MILAAAKQLGFEIPHFCYHPGLSIAGNCRMCLVEVEKKSKPVIGCNTPVAEGMVVRTATDMIKKIRESVMEFLLINHPLDCPTCDQAGECRLQDYYMQFDVKPTRFEEEKIHKDKMVDLGSQVMLDQERCIACTRCIRFCDEIAGVEELTMANRGDHVTITTFPGKKLSNPYAGNVVDICPVGALTNKDFRFKKRVWFLTTSPSICPGCSRGCNIEIHHADRKVYRLKPRENLQVNKYWMCDEGRFGYKFINENRVLRARLKKQGAVVPTSNGEASYALADILKHMLTDEVAVVAHAAETNETLGVLHAFAEGLQTNQLLATRFDPPNPFSDNYLITADKNPNQKEVDRLGFKSFNQIKKPKGLIVLHSLSPKELEVVRQNKIPVLAVFAVNETPVCELAQIVFPLASYAEQEGHFTNVLGRVQQISKAFRPLGESKTLPFFLDLVEKAMQQTKKAVGI